jgi:hydroxymethylpyrimidine pyrophosphatase-like HAD family hydrolase
MFHVTAAEQHVEFLSPGTNKASGLRRACEALGMTMEETVAFGDADNDAEMLAACGLSFAMPGSRPKAIEAADRMCEFDNSNEGVAVELRALIDEGCIGTSRSVEKKASMSMR